jgi:hypothetical protein
MAVEQIMGHLYFRSWRLPRFPADLLLISDSPVGMWTPVPPSADCPSGQDFAVGVANASIVCLPLNRRTALAMTMHKGPDKAIDSGPTRARQINMALVHDAQRWIYHNPDDRHLDGIDIPEPAVFTDEIVAVNACREDASAVAGALRGLARGHGPQPGACAVRITTAPVRPCPPAVADTRSPRTQTAGGNTVDYASDWHPGLL